MSLKGRIAKLGTKVKRHGQELAKPGFSNITRPANKKEDHTFEVVNAKNVSGEKITAYNCVRILEGETESAILSFTYPAATDDEESIMYGSLLNDVEIDGTGIIQLTGAALFRLAPSLEKVLVGDKIYPVVDSGTVCNDGSGNTYVDIPIGRSLKMESDTTALMEVLLGGSMGGSGSGLSVVCCATKNIETLEGELILDDIQTSEGDLVLLPFQSTPEDCGIYTVSVTAWTKYKSFTNKIIYDPIFVALGTVFGRTTFQVTQENVAKWCNKSYAVKTAISTGGGSGTGSFGGTTVSAGDLVLKTTEGIYIVQTGTWTLVVSFGVDTDGGEIIGVESGTYTGKVFIVVGVTAVILASDIARYS